MCQQHLLGEHVEMHMFLGSLRKRISVAGYLRGNMFEPTSLLRRHDELVKEMLARGMNHHTPLDMCMDDLEHLTTGELIQSIDREAAQAELLRRCPECRKKRFELSIEKPKELTED